MVHRWYNVGQLSIQRAAVWILEKYYQDFPIYNPYLDRVPSKKKHHNSVNSSFKYYDVDGEGDTGEVSLLLTRISLLEFVTTM